MNTRIRYVRYNDKEIVSMQILKANDGKEYKVLINTDTNMGLILHVTKQIQNSVLVQGTSLHKTKIKVKKALEELGVEFEKEQRKVRDESQ